MTRALPKPEAVEQDVALIRRLLSSLMSEYRWVYGYALSPTVAPSVTSSWPPRRAIPEPPRDPDEQRQGHVGEPPSDPTGTVVASEAKRQARDHGREMARCVEIAAKLVDKAVGIAQRHYGYRARDLVGLDKDGADLPEVEMKRLKGRQEAREARGEGWGHA